MQPVGWNGEWQLAEASTMETSYKCQRENGKKGETSLRIKKILLRELLTQSLTHYQQETSSIDTEIVVHRFRVFGEVAE